MSWNWPWSAILMVNPTGALGLLHGFTAFAVSLSWMTHIFNGSAVLLWLLLALFPTLFAHFHGRAWARGWSGWKFEVFTALNWCAWEFIRAELFPLKFPWMTAGLAIGPNVLLPWIGVYGVSLIVVFAAASISSRKLWPALGASAILVAGVGLCFPCPEPVATDASSVKMAGIQMENVSCDRFLSETGKLPADVKYVVWPEYSVPFDIRKSERDWALIQALCDERNITLTFGTQAVSGKGGEWRNIALTMDASGVRGEHAKVHTVHFFDDGIPGKTQLPVTTDYGKIGTPICFDGDYEGVIRGMTKEGAEMIVIPTMDAETWSVRQHEQHAELACIRACENGRWAFACATSGVSQVIDSHGHVHARLAALEQGVMTQTMKRETALTFYTCFGWLCPWVSLVLAAVGWVWVFLPKRWKDDLEIVAP
ncbi:MAG: nitrilase-related carbon-nitrogen hydrolase [Luteolibacter sp.]